MPVAAKYRRITATTDDGVVAAFPCTLYRVVIGTLVATQSITIYDSSTEGGIGASNTVIVIQLDTRGTFDFGPNGIRMNSGLTAIVSGGTSSVTIVWG